MAIGLAAVLGLLAGVGIGVLRELRERFFRTGDQVRDELKLEFLGFVPRPRKATSHEHFVGVFRGRFRKVTVQDASGREVDLTAFIGQDAEEGEDSVEVATEEPAEEPAPPAAEVPAEEPAQPAAEEPAAAAPKKATRKRRKDAESE